jgi:adenine specific DNA methylase Mod
VDIRENKQLGDVFKSKEKSRRDLKEYLRITPRGKKYLDVYQKMLVDQI